MANFVFWLLFGGILSCSPAVFCSTCCGKSGSCVNKVTSAECSNNNNKNTNVNFNGFCLDNCPIGYYPDDGKCLSCHAPCLACNKSGCLSCDDLNFRSQNGECGKTCNLQLMKNSSSPRTRLVQGQTNLEGVVEVYHNGSWGTICADGWDDKAAKVVCNELKLGNVIEPVIVGQDRFVSINGYKDAKIWLSGVKCSGDESSISQCKHEEWGQNFCSHLEDAGIRCSGPEMTRTCESSCGDGYYASNGECLKCPLSCKTCSSFNYCSSCHIERFLQGNKCVSRCKPGMFGDLKTQKCEACPDICETCVGHPGGTMCTSCPSNKLTKYLHVGQCTANCPGGVASSKYLRLSGNFSTPYKGLLEVKYDGAWHTVCDDSFYLDTARVFCRELGYGPPIFYRGGEYGHGKGRILTLDVSCNGNENSFIDCHQSDWFSPGCSHVEDVGLWCEPPTDGIVVQERCIDKCPQGMFENKERVCELCNRKCLSCKETPDNCLNCRAPFYYDGTSCVRACPNGTYANATLRRCLPCNSECMTCNDGPGKCLSCRQPLLHNGTRCSSTCPDKMLRKEYSCVSKCGLKHYPKGKVCHACPVKCLLCKSSSQCVACVHGFVLTKQGKCERSCASGQYSTSVDPKSLGINLPLRLTSVEGYKFKGRLEIKHNGEWGTICDDGWTRKNADVACRQLFLGPPVKIVYLRSDSAKKISISQIWMDDVDCTGNEDSLADCKFNDWGVENCVHSEDVHIECQRPGISSCEDECPPAYYKNQTSCEACSISCLNCTGMENNCTLCKPGFFRTINNTCVNKCPSNFYQSDDRHCMPCHWTCWTCTGPKDTDCTSCKRPRLLHGDMCDLSCPKDYYEMGVNPTIELWNKKGPYEGVVMVTVKGKKGFVCHRFLRTEVGNVICRQLEMGTALEVYETSMYRYFSTPALVKNSKCTGNESSIFDCQENWITSYCSRRSMVSVRCSGPDLSSRCTKSCPQDKNFYVTDKRVCAFCSTKCLRCEKNASRCTACPQGYLLTWDHQCVEYCHEGTYYDTKTKKCEQCNLKKCVACYGNKDICTVCRDNKYSGVGGCQDACKTGRLKVSGISRLRLSDGENASQGFVEIFEEGIWTAICGMKWDIRGAAVVCHQLGYGDPIRTSSRYQTVPGVMPEKMTNFNCTGTEETLSDCPKLGFCLGSKVVLVYCSRSTPRKSCSDNCEPGYYLTADKTECLPCSSDCTTCTGKASHCTSCNNTHILHGSTCVENCPDGYFAHLEDKTCQRCSDECKTCFDGWTNYHCSSCDDPFYLRDTSCVESCYPDHTLEDLMASEKPSGKVRIANGSVGQDGMIEVSVDGVWGIVCYANRFVASLVCQELGYESGIIIKSRSVYRFIRFVKYSASCKSFEKSLAECRISSANWCPRAPVISCSKKKMDKRVCRKGKKVPCSRGTCYYGVTCANGNDNSLTKDYSYCRKCPPNYFGDGDNCTAISHYRPTVRQEYIERQLYLRSTYYFPCYGRAGIRSIYGNRYSWFKNGKPVSGLRRSLVLKPVYYRDTAIYKCVLRTSTGSATITYNITVVGPPIIVRADDVDIVHGDSVMLTCVVDSNPEAVVTWQFNNITFGMNSTRHGGPRMLANGSLLIPHPIEQDEGNYTCIARNAYRTVTEEVRLRISEELSFKRKVGSVTVVVGKMAKFTCRPLSTGKVMSIKWRRNGETLKTGSKYDVNDETLTINDVSAEDCGEYYCVARDGHLIITSVGTLAIKNGYPCIHTPPQNLVLEYGMYARFFCAASGDPVPRIKWQGKPQPNPNVFEIEKVNLSHVGVYTCTASSGGKVKHKYAFLSVGGNHPCPFIFKKPENTPVNFGQQAIFNCDGVAIKLRTISWYRDNKKIHNSAKYKLINGNRKLVINNVNVNDVGKYKCVVRGQYGESSASALLTSTKVGSLKGSSSSPNIAGIVVGVLICILVVIIVLFFVYRYRRHGTTPVDVIKDVKRKTVSRFQSPARHTILKYNTEDNGVDEDGEVYDTSDTNPFVRD